VLGETLNDILRITGMKLILTIILPLFFIQAYGQIDNRSQPDSIYQNRKVKKIYAYLNSKKDLSEIIEFDRGGRKIRSVKYSASYDKKTRGRKRIDLIRSFKYDSESRLTQIIDSVIYWNNSCRVNNRYFYYDTNGALNVVKYYEAPFQTPVSETYYYQNPFRTTTIRQNDTLILYCKTKEYEKGFYVNKFYGYYYEAKLKSGVSVYRGDTSRYQYSDYSDMQRFEDTTTIKNTFNSKGQLITSDVNSVFMNERASRFKLTYNYYSNGLLKNIRGYVPEFFKYEFYD
jgi:hypothetical protein